MLALPTAPQVDGAILSAWQSYTANAAHLTAVVEAQRAARGADLEAFNAARAAYLKKVEESVAFVKEQGLQGTAKVGRHGSRFSVFSFQDYGLCAWAPGHCTWRGRFGVACGETGVAPERAGR